MKLVLLVFTLVFSVNFVQAGCYGTTYTKESKADFSTYIGVRDSAPAFAKSLHQAKKSYTELKAKSRRESSEIVAAFSGSHSEMDFINAQNKLARRYRVGFDYMFADFNKVLVSYDLEELKCFTEMTNLFDVL